MLAGTEDRKILNVFVKTDGIHFHVKLLNSAKIYFFPFSLFYHNILGSDDFLKTITALKTCALLY